ncbi:MAG: MarR family transcriptional regulator [Solirubrobacterales bacterium]
MSRKTKKDLIGELIEVTRANQVATDKMDEAGGLALGVNRTDGRCLDLIDQAGRISAGELASAAGMTTGAVTTIIDRLEAKGYVRRIPDPNDRRRVLVEATEEMRTRAWSLWGPISERAMPTLERLSMSDLELLIRFMRLGSELNETRAAEIRAELRH